MHNKEIMAKHEEMLVYAILMNHLAFSQAKRFD
jgi:hypothetical protein